LVHQTYISLMIPMSIPRHSPDKLELVLEKGEPEQGKLCDELTSHGGCLETKTVLQCSSSAGRTENGNLSVAYGVHGRRFRDLFGVR
jgi:hypothetical protein